MKVYFTEPSNRKYQGYVSMKWEYWSTKLKIKHHLRHENKVNENKVLTYCKASRCETIKKCFPLCQIYKPIQCSNIPNIVAGISSNIHLTVNCHGQIGQEEKYPTPSYQTRDIFALLECVFPYSDLTCGIFQLIIQIHNEIPNAISGSI